MASFCPPRALQCLSVSLMLPVVPAGTCWEIEMTLREALTTCLSVGSFLRDLTDVI